MKNIIVGVLTLLVVALMAYTAMGGGAFHGGEHGKIIEDIKDIQKPAVQAVSGDEDENVEQDELKALRDKAGNIGSFKVSQDYKSKCASCHGINGEGSMGPKLIGQTSEDLYQKLLDYKAGRIENPVMRGLLLSIDKEKLRELADEIGGFEAKAASQQ